MDAKVYVVSGKNFLGQPVSERVMAISPAAARKAASKVASHSKVQTAATAASKYKR